MTTLDQAMQVILSEAARRKVGLPLSDEELLRAEVAFANTGSVPARRTPGPPDEVYEAQRKFRAYLQAFVDGRLTNPDVKRIRRAAFRVVLVPKPDKNGQLGYLTFSESRESGVALAMTLLLDPTKSYGADLKQCQWKDCNRIEDEARKIPHVRKFFFVSERREIAAAQGKRLAGALPDRYCCEDHMRKAHRERATAATNALRKRLREQQQQAAEPAPTRHK